MDYFNQESERLLYRQLTKEDIPRWIEFFIDNDRLKYLGLDLSKSKEELAEGWINAQLARYKNQGLGHLAIVLKESGEFIGMGGILPRVLNENEEFEIAYSLLPAYWGFGYATELARTMKIYGFKNIETNRFVSIIDVGNEASANVAKKNEMKVLFKTKYLGMDVDVYGVNKTDFNSK